MTKPILEKIAYVEDHSFAIREDLLPFIKIPLHLHPEFELTFIIESYGTRVIGDSIENFESGDLIFIGPELPHFWRNDKAFYENKQEQQVRLLVVHFPQDFLGNQFFETPELHTIKKFLMKSYRGVKIVGETSYFIKEQMIKMYRERGFARLMILFAILDRLSKSNDIQLLASEGYKNSINTNDTDRINQIYEYMVDHFAENISLDDVSSQVNMSPSAFCRYIRNRVGKPFKQVLTEIRIGRACKEILETEKTIAQIAYESGFNNLSNFNRRFMENKQMSPSQFKAMYRVF
jgi:AraC-like DNA-binding protein